MPFSASSSSYTLFLIIGLFTSTLPAFFYHTVEGLDMWETRYAREKGATPPRNTLVFACSVVLGTLSLSVAYSRQAMSMRRRLDRARAGTDVSRSQVAKAHPGLKGSDLEEKVRGYHATQAWALLVESNAMGVLAANILFLALSVGLGLFIFSHVTPPFNYLVTMVVSLGGTLLLSTQ